MKVLERGIVHAFLDTDIWNLAMFIVTHVNYVLMQTSFGSKGIL